MSGIIFDPILDELRTFDGGGGGGSGITSINGATGPAITIAPAGGLTINTVGNTITVTGGAGLWQSFSAPGVTISALIGLTPDVNFAVFTDNGSGTLTKISKGDYTFTSGTGAIAVPAGSGNYRVTY